MTRDSLLKKIAAELNQDPDFSDVYTQGDVIVVVADTHTYEVEVHDA